MEETLTRQIKVFCPQHQSVFEVADAPKIVCEIREHSLSNDFPNAEFWEYCCDCQIFSPSDLEVGGKAKTACPQCERPTISHFVCGNCKTISFDSGEDTKGKIFQLDLNAKTIEPSCAGCLKDFAGADLKLHKCEEAQAIYLTSRKDCPFCKKEIVPPAKKKAVAQNLPTQNVAKVGTSVAKTKLLGSICPTCGAISEPDSVFCANCGQILKEVTPTPKQLPPNMPPIPTEVANPTVVDNVKPATSAKSSNTNGCLIAVGVLFGVIVLCVIFQGILSTKNSTTSTANTKYNSNSNSNKSNNSYMSNTLTMNSNNAIDSNMTSSDSSLSTSFSRDYTGKIGKKDFTITMSLTRDGSRLTGTASTSKTDYLYGTIESDGSFTLDGKENDIKLTGKYIGRIYSDGSIRGTWTSLESGKSSSFSLSED